MSRNSAKLVSISIHGTRKMNDLTEIRFDRRAFLGGALGASLIGMPLMVRAGTMPMISGLAFSGNLAFACGEGLLVSRDGGARWSVQAGPERRTVGITAHPERAERLIVALEVGGIAVSNDGGGRFERKGRGLPDIGIGALATAAQLPDTIYAAIPGDGLWRSEDAGESWEFVMDRPFIAGEERDVLSLCSVDLASGMGGIWLYGGTRASLQRVPDCFCRWQDVQPEHALDALVDGATESETAPLPVGESVYALVSAPSAPSQLWAALPSGIWASEDAGLIWGRANKLDATSLAVDPANANNLIAATPDGLFHSRDAGQSWAASAVL